MAQSILLHFMDYKSFTALPAGRQVEAPLFGKRIVSSLKYRLLCKPLIVAQH